MTTAADEWRKYWFLPLVGGLGYSVMALQTYAIGVFVAPLEAEFGWSRAQVLMGLTISNGIGALLNMAVGVMVDRVGPRRVALTGIIVKGGAFALLATATGAIFNWYALWVLVAFGAMLLQAQVWTSAVSSRFDIGRGLAIAVALCGTSFAAVVCPVLGTWLITEYGWRAAFAGMGLIWIAVSILPVFFLFRGKQDSVRELRELEDPAAPASAVLPGMTLAEGLRKPAFLKLLFAGASYAFYTMAMSPNLVPMLTEIGSSAMVAASIASLMGLVAIAGRLSAGWMVDRWPAHIVGAAVFLLPVIGCLVLLTGSTSLIMQGIAVAAIGATIGAEFDVVIYLVSRHFGLKAFGALMGAVLSAGALGGAIAPVLSGYIHDVTGTYDVLLYILIGLLFANALSMLTLGRPPEIYAADFDADAVEALE